jgi:hypothetical protein
MSIESWKQEYYTDPSLCTNDRERAEHTKLKYIGVRKENLARHGLVQKYAGLYSDKREFGFSGLSCSFCRTYTNKSGCNSCPLYKEDQWCEINADGEDLHELVAYDHFVKGDPEPMITLMDTILSKCDEDGVYRQ